MPATSSAFWSLLGWPALETPFSTPPHAIIQCLHIPAIGVPHLRLHGTIPAHPGSHHFVTFALGRVPDLSEYWPSGKLGGCQLINLTSASYPSCNGLYCPFLLQPAEDLCQHSNVSTLISRGERDTHNGDVFVCKMKPQEMWLDGRAEYDNMEVELMLLMALWDSASRDIQLGMCKVEALKRN